MPYYAVRPEDYPRANAWSRVYHRALFCAIGIVLSTLYVFGLLWTTPWFWDSLFYFNWLPWTVLFVFLVATGLTLVARYQVGRMALVLVEIPQEIREPVTEETQVIEGEVTSTPL